MKTSSQKKMLQLFSKEIFTAIFFLLFFLTSCNLGKKKTDWVECELIPVCENGKWGYINSKGEWVIKPQFFLNDSKLGGESISFFSEGLARVKSANGLFGFINAKGDFVIPPIYKQVTSFHEGVALSVKENETIEVINRMEQQDLNLVQMLQSYRSFMKGLLRLEMIMRQGTTQ